MNLTYKILTSGMCHLSLATVVFVASQSSLSAEVKTVIKQQLENMAIGWQTSRMVSF